MVDISLDALIERVRPDVRLEIERRAVAAFAKALEREQRRALIKGLEDLADVFRGERIENQIHDHPDPAQEHGAKSDH